MMRIDRWKVRQEMERANIGTFRELAEMIGVSQQAVSAWFRGAGFTSENLAALCYALDCQPGDILTLDPNRVAPGVEARAQEMLTTASV